MRAFESGAALRVQSAHALARHRRGKPGACGVPGGLALLAALAFVGAPHATAAGASAPSLVFAGPAPAPEAVAVARQALAATASQVSTLDRARSLYEALRTEGWLWAKLRPSARGDTLHVLPGPRARLGSVAIEGADSAAVALFVRAAGWLEGSPYRPAGWAEQAQRGLAALGELGHPFANLAVRSLAADESTAVVRPRLWLSPGPQAVVGSVSIVGATHTRQQVLQRISGIRPGAPYRESMVRDARQRLLAREVIASVRDVAPRPRDGVGADVDLRIAVEQTPSTGRVAAALGLVRDAQDDRTRLSGSVDLAFLDLFGTARQLRATWLDDGATRRKLDIGWLEPLVLGTPLDLRVGLGQRHQDELFDTVLADLGLRLPWTGEFALEVGAGVDRTTFVSSGGRTRNRQRLSVTAGVTRERGAGAGAYGSLHTRVEMARVRESFTLTDSVATAAHGAASESQTIVDARGRAGWALASMLAVEGRAAWQSVDGERLPVPDSELWYVGGATTVRGYREEQFRGESVGFGGAEFVVGPSHRGQGYAFYDLGWVRRTVTAAAGGLERRDVWLHGFGLGLRTPTAAGRVDLSVGFADRLSFDAGKLHLALVQDF